MSTSVSSGYLVSWYWPELGASPLFLWSWRRVLSFLVSIYLLITMTPFDSLWYTTLLMILGSYYFLIFIRPPRPEHDSSQNGNSAEETFRPHN